MENEKNEFDDIDAGDEEPPQQTFSDTPGSEDIGSNDTVEEYDFDKAPDTLPAPERVDLNGKEVTIIDAKIMKPKLSDPVQTSRSGKVEYKRMPFKLFYSEGGQQEFISGVACFKRDDGSYSHPSIAKTGENQATKLLLKYAEFKNKDVKEVSMKEFLMFLKSKPKVVIVSEEFNNPTTGKAVKKNMVGKFI